MESKTKTKTKAKTNHRRKTTVSRARLLGRDTKNLHLSIGVLCTIVFVLLLGFGFVSMVPSKAWGIGFQSRICPSIAGGQVSGAQTTYVLGE